MWWHLIDLDSDWLKILSRIWRHVILESDELINLKHLNEINEEWMENLLIQMIIIKDEIRFGMPNGM